MSEDVLRVSELNEVDNFALGSEVTALRAETAGIFVWHVLTFDEIAVCQAREDGEVETFVEFSGSLTFDAVTLASL